MAAIVDRCCGVETKSGGDSGGTSTLTDVDDAAAASSLDLRPDAVGMAMVVVVDFWSTAPSAPLIASLPKVGKFVAAVVVVLAAADLFRGGGGGGLRLSGSLEDLSVGVALAPSAAAVDRRRPPPVDESPPLPLAATRLMRCLRKNGRDVEGPERL